MLRRFFCVFGYIIFIISPPSLPSHNFTSSLFSSLLSSSLLSSPLLFSSLFLLSVVFRCLCCVCAVVGARAAVVAPGGFCTFLSGCFSFLGNFSFFLVNFSFTQAIPE